MSQMRVLVVSPGNGTGAWLAERLSPARYEVTTVEPGPGLIAGLRRTRPHVAVVDGIDGRPQAAQLEIGLLKDQSPEVQIIATSERSSEHDAAVVEQGIFYYLAGCSRDDLLRVVEAAARRRPQE